MKHIENKLNEKESSLNSSYSESVVDGRRITANLDEAHFLEDYLNT